MRWTRMLGAAALALLCGAFSARAQVVVDGSLDSLNSGPVDVVDGNNYEIGDDWGVFSDGGESRFHSFSQLDIPSGWIATFSSDASPSRVFARVVEPGPANWASGSQIDGTLRCTIPGADLFLLNPRGITFGQGAELDVQGSFHASTADVLRFSDGKDFDAQVAAPLPDGLSTAAPSAFGFKSARPAAIAVFHSQGLGVPAGKTLSFVAGEFKMVSHSGADASIAAPGARVQVVAAGGPAEIPIVDGDLVQIDPADLPPAADYGYEDGSCSSCGQVGFAVQAEVNVSSPHGGGAPAGSILIRGGRFVLASSRLVAEHREDGLDATGPIDVAVNGGIEIDSSSAVLTSTEAGGRGGDVLLSGESVSVGGGSSVKAGSTGPGASGDVWIAATEEVAITGAAEVFSNPRGEGAGGGIAVSAKALEVSSGSQITLKIDGGGAEAVADGKIEIDVAETVVVEGTAQIGTINSGRAGGGIEIDAETIAVRDAGQIVSRSQGPSAGGPIVLTSDALEVSDGGHVQSEAEAGGDGGPIDIEAESVLVSNETHHPNGTFIFTETQATEDGGRGGDLTLRTRSLELVDGGQIFTRTTGSGDAGSLRVLGADFVYLRGVDPGVDGTPRPSGITGRASTTATAEARGGDITVEARILEVDDGAQISSATFGAGSAGDLTIRGEGGTPAESVTIRGGEEGFTLVSAASRLREGSPATLGASGELTISARTVALVDGGQVSVSTAGKQDAGNIVISADNVSISGVDPGVGDRSGVFAQSNAVGVAGGGAGGDITITARENMRVADDGRVSVSTEPYSEGDAGAITLDVGGALELDSGGSIVALSSSEAKGEGGSIAITAGERVSVGGGSEISAQALGSGNAGRITIDAGRRFESRNSSVTTESQDSSGGEIEIRALEALTLVDSDVTTSVQAGVEGAGNITIDPELVVLNRSRIIARAYGGPGGSISITAGAFLASSDSEVDADSALSIDGVVEINAPEVVLAGELATLPESFLDASALLSSACEARSARAGSFVVQRYADLEAPPDTTVSLVSAGLPAVGAAGELPQCPLGEEVP